MSGSSVTSREHAAFDDHEQPTRRKPAFDLAAESRRLDEAHAADLDSTVTIGPEENRRLLASVFALASDLAPHSNTDDEPTLDAPAPVLVGGVPCDEPPPRPARVSARPPALRSFVITSPAPVASARAPRSAPKLAVAPEAVISLDAVPTVPANLPRPQPSLVMTASAQVPAFENVVVPPSSRRLRVTPQLAEAAREVREAGERRAQQRRNATTFTIRLPKTTSQTWIVAGIWAMALSLVAVLMIMATSA